MGLREDLGRQGLVRGEGWRWRGAVRVLHREGWESREDGLVEGCGGEWRGAMALVGRDGVCCFG